MKTMWIERCSHWVAIIVFDVYLEYKNLMPKFAFNLMPKYKIFFPQKFHQVILSLSSSADQVLSSKI